MSESGAGRRSLLARLFTPRAGSDAAVLEIAGILDVLDDGAFVRTSGYLPGPKDVSVSTDQVQRYGLRPGDAVTGVVAEASTSLLRLNTVNGMDPDEAPARPEFAKLTPVHPRDRLRLETEPHLLTTRVIDLVMPVGKGQRALIVAPPRAGTTMVLRAIASAIAINNPECHLMLVLVDERPEEVTVAQRSVTGEVIASTVDRPARDHTRVAELAFERARRLVELGHDVVVLLDSLTRLARSDNGPDHGLEVARRLLGAGRRIEHGGSLTVLATALVETGSTMDTAVFEQLTGAGNAELRLARDLAGRDLFPAVDIAASGTRDDEVLLAPDERAGVATLRQALRGLDPATAMERLLEQLRASDRNAELLAAPAG